MTLLQKNLFIKTSGIPDAGNGLFTKQFIGKGTRIIEYTGKITTWNRILQVEQDTKIINRYLYYLDNDHVIDASDHPNALARYANDANGLVRLKGKVNNAKYVEENAQVFMEATKDIPVGAEIFISYGKEYWDTVKNLIACQQI
ncbi:SET domain-containing protein [Ginsengibacter hankyongi]|uniref:SET domain-containing protein n=1 Tax=Ginsengibacter hankyongi TaxID=2607284 RepID=A0A5J5IFT4_9BACT|nr:SET domain-containing protein [Ginsengibacter hankyongi]KAA9038752.1 SET domain-containing protein [Ginsengibacter hankyongi]